MFWKLNPELLDSTPAMTKPRNLKKLSKPRLEHSTSINQANTDSGNEVALSLDLS